MTPSGSNNQSILLRIAPATLHLPLLEIIEEYWYKYTVIHKEGKQS